MRGAASTFTVEVTNNDASAAVDDPTLVVELPGNVDFSTSTAPAGCSFDLAATPRRLTCTRPSLAAQTTWTTVFQGNGETAGVAITKASISAVGNSDGNPGNDELTKYTTVIKGANLDIVKSGPASATAGDVISFTLAVSNVNGPDPATTFRVIDNLPATADFTYQSYSGTNWSCSHGGTTLTCDYSGAPIASGASAPAITVTGRIVTTAGSITNGASVVSTDAATGDPVLTNNGPSLAVVTVAPGTTLRANKTMVSTATGMTTYATGEAVTLTLSATNLGPQNATGVTLTDSVPADFAIGALPGGCSAAGQNITCTVGNLNNGATSSNFVIPLTVTGAAGSGGKLSAEGYQGSRNEIVRITNQYLEQLKEAGKEGGELPAGFAQDWKQLLDLQRRFFEYGKPEDTVDLSRQVLAALDQKMQSGYFAEGEKPTEEMMKKAEPKT